MTLTIEEGKYYKTADGRTIGPAIHSALRSYPWRVGTWDYTNDGKFYADNSESVYDIVAEASGPVEDDGFVTLEAPGWVQQVEAEAATERDESIVGMIDGQPVHDIKTVIADEAKRIVSGARRSAYGRPEQNFERISALWTGYAKAKGWPIEFTAGDVSPMMILMKIARTVESPAHYDSWVDAVGYALTAAETNGVSKPVA